MSLCSSSYMNRIYILGFRRVEGARSWKACKTLNPFEDPQIEGCLLCIGEGCVAVSALNSLGKSSLWLRCIQSEWSKIASEQNTPLAPGKKLHEGWFSGLSLEWKLCTSEGAPDYLHSHFLSVEGCSVENKVLKFFSYFIVLWDNLCHVLWG